MKLREITWKHVKSRKITWKHVKLRDFTRNYVKSRELRKITYNHVKLRKITWNHVKSRKIIYLDSSRMDFAKDLYENLLRTFAHAFEISHCPDLGVLFAIVWPFLPNLVWTSCLHFLLPYKSQIIFCQNGTFPRLWFDQYWMHVKYEWQKNSLITTLWCYNVICETHVQRDLNVDSKIWYLNHNVNKTVFNSHSQFLNKNFVKPTFSLMNHTPNWFHEIFFKQEFVFATLYIVNVM